MGFSIVDDSYNRVPAVERDAFWGEACPEPLYTAEAVNRNSTAMVGSCSEFHILPLLLVWAARQQRKR